MLQSPCGGAGPSGSAGPGGADAPEAPEEVGSEASGAGGPLFLSLGGIRPALLCHPAISVSDTPCVPVRQSPEDGPGVSGKLPGLTGCLLGPLTARTDSLCAPLPRSVPSLVPP